MQYHGAAYAEDAWDVYWFEKNIFGDIVSVYDNSGNLLLVYNYDAYGEWSINSHNDGIDTPAGKNPFRYRGYYYDSDLDMYYLNARYYDPYTGRFISPEPNVYSGGFDRSNSLIGKNAYVYCMNNPVNNSDPTGEWTFSLSFGFFCGMGAGKAGEPYGANVGISVDSQGMVVIQITYINAEEKENSATGLSFSYGLNMQFTNLNSVDDLDGSSRSTGINSPVFSGDIIKDAETNEVVGWSVPIGPTIGGDFHDTKTETKNIIKFPSLIEIIKGWLGF